MSVSPDPYVPKYTTLEDVPVTGPDPWDEPEKLRAIERGENRLEADVNEGIVIPVDAREGIHSDAAALFANYLLALGPKAPDSIFAGDFADEGSRREEFHDHLLQQYKETIAAINNAAGDESGGEGDENNDGSAGYLRSSIL